MLLVVTSCLALGIFAFPVAAQDPETGDTPNDGLAVPSETAKDAELTVSVADPAAAVTEGDDPATTANMIFPVTLSTASGQDVTVPYTLGGSAAAGDDYEDPASKSVTISAGNTTADITIKVRGDTADEANETVTVTLGAPTGATVSAQSGAETASGTITDDDDAPSATLTVSPATIAESGKGNSAIVTASLSAATHEDVTITVSVEEVASVTLSTNETLTVKARATASTETVTLTAVDNDVDAADATVEVSGIASGAGVANPGTVTLTITDDDGRGISVSPKTLTLAEVDDTSTTDATENVKTYTVALDSAPTGAVTVSVASSDENVAKASPSTLTFTAENYAAKTVTVTAVADDPNNADDQRTTTITHTVSAPGTDYAEIAAESVAVTVTAVSDLTAGSDEVAIVAAATGDDVEVLSVDSPSVTEGANGATATLTFTVTLSAASSQAVTVAYADAGSGSATSGTDYTAITSGTLTFAAGDTSKTVAVTVTGDDLDEDNETVVLRLSSASGAMLSGGASTLDATGTITDDDATPTLSVADAASVTEGDDPQTTADMSFTVTLSAASSRDVTAAYTLGGSATAGSDYEDPQTKSVTISAGSTSADIVIKVKGDTADEDNETIEVTLGLLTNATLPSAVGAGVASGTITDDDETPGVVVSKRTMNIVENSTPGTYTLKLATRPAGEVTITLSADPSGVIAFFVLGEERDPSAPITATFDESNWNQPKTVALRGGDDVDDENHSVTISHSVKGYGDVTSADSVTIAVTDDDATPAVLLDRTSVTVAEGGTSTYTVKLATNPGGTVTVTPKSDDVTVASVSGPVSLDATNWYLGASVTVTGVEDDDGATGRASLSHKVEGYGDVTNASPVSVTVTDDDAALVLTKTIVIVYEGFDAAQALSHQTYEVSLAAKPAGTVTVTPESQDDARVSVSGPLTFDTENWSKPQKVTLNGVLDEDGYDHKVVIDHSVTGYGAAPVTVQATVKDYHGKTLNVRPRELTLAQGKTASYAVKLRTDPLATVTVTPAVEDETAATVSGTMTFDSSNWSVDQTATVTAKVDNKPETKNTTVTHSVSGYSGYIETHPGDFFVHGLHGNDAPVVSTVAVKVTRDEPGFSISRSSVTVTEAAGASRTATYRIAPGRRPTGTVTVSLVSGDTSVATVTPAELTFTPAEYVRGGAFRSGAKTVTVTGVDDDVDNKPDRTTTITHSASGGGYDSASAKVSVTVTDDETPGVLVSKRTMEVTEGGEVDTYTLKLTAPPDNQVVVEFSAKPSGVIAVICDPCEFDSRDSGEVTFDQNDWNQSKTVYVGALDDDDDEDESVTISHAVTGYGDITSADSVSVAVIDDDRPPEFSIADASVVEGDTGTADLQFAVTLSPAVDEAATVDWATSTETTDTATPGTDYTTASGTLNFAAEEASKTVTVKVAGDLIAETDETLTLTLSNASGELALADAIATGTITDDDDAPAGAITLALSPASAAESAGATTVRVTATMPGTTARAADTAITVKVGDSSDDATEGTDYGTVDDFTLTVAAGDRTGSATFDIDPTQDTVDEGTGETLSVSGTTAAPGLSVTGADFTITEFDAAPTVTLALMPASIKESSPTASETKSTVTASLSAVAHEDVTITISVPDDAPVTLSATTALTIAKGQTASTGTVTLTAVDNEVDAANASVEVSGSASGADVANPETVTLNIIDDDGRGISVSETALTLAEADDPGTADAAENVKTYTVGLDSQPTGTVTVEVASSDTGVATASPATLTFTAENYGAKPVTVTAVADDLENEGDERGATITHAVTATGTDYDGQTAASVTVKVADDDEMADLIISPTSVTVTEAAGASRTATYKVALAARPTAEVTVALASADETAATVLPAELTFATDNWEAGQTVTVTGVDDSLHNRVETQERRTEIRHTASGGGYGSVTGKLVVTVTDDEAAPAFSVADASVVEGDTGTADLSFVVTVSPAAAYDMVVTRQTSDGTAKSGADYTGILGARRVSKGETSKTFTVKVAGDEVDEGDETLFLTLSGLRGWNGSSFVEGPELDDATATGTIIDDDAPTVTLVLTPASIKESSSTASETVSTVTATLSAASSQAVSLTVAADPVAPAVDADVTLSANKTLTIAAGATASTGAVTITAVDNSVDAPDKTVTVSAKASGGGVADPDDKTLTITDDDDAPAGAITLALSPKSAAESAAATTVRVTATMPGTTARAADTAITVKVGDSSDDATEGTDYATVADFTLTVAAGARTGSATFDIDPTQDTVDEGTGETLSVAGTTAAPGLSVTGADFTITDDDDAPTVTLVLTPASIKESSSTASETVSTVTATLSAASSQAVSLTVAADPVAPAVDADVTLSANKTLTIAAGATASTGAVTITAVDNSVDAPDKTVTVSAKASGGGVADPDDKTLTITDDDDAPAGAITLALSPKSAAESAAATTVRVTATMPGTTARAADTAITVKVGDSSDDATEGTDYATVADFTLTVAAGARTGSATFDIDPTQDTVDEGTGETLSVAGTTAAPGLSVTGADFTITDDDDAPTVTLVLTPASIKESSSTASETVSTVTATLSAASSQAVSLTVAAPDKTVTVSAKASGGGVADPDDKTLTITDDDDAPAGAITPTGAIARSLILTVSPDEIEEASGVSTIMVSTKDDATFQTDQTITLTLGGTATKGMDYHYTTTMETLTLKAGETFVSTEVMAMQDAIVEDDEMVMISASHNGAEIPSPSSLLSHGTADAFGARLARSIMIMDDDARSVVVTPTSLTVAESDDATTHGRRENEATYTVVLTSEPTGQVTVSTQSSDEDVATVAPSLLRFTAENWNRPQTVTVSGVDDARTNPGDKRETQIMHAVSGGDYAGLTADPVSVQVNDDPGVLVHRAWLSRFGRTVAEQSIAAIRGRIAADRNSGFEGRFAGPPLPGTGAADYPKSLSASHGSPKAGEVLASRTSPGLADDLAENALPAFRSFLAGGNEGDPEIRELSADDVLLKSSFALARDTGTGTVHGFWGRAARSGFEGRDNDTVVDGEVTSVMLGTDWDRKGALFGMVLSRSRGAGTYRGTSSGAIDARLTSLVPYAGRDTGGRLSLWGAAGIGIGDVTLTPDGMAPARADIRWNMAAAGAEGALTPRTGADGIELGWHADALWTRTVSEDSNGLGPTSGETTRLRLGLKAAWERTLATGVTLGSRLEAGFRHDGGDAETGHGLEIGGGLALADPRRGISVSLEGRTLALHEDGRFRNWGLGLSASWDPRPETRRGWSATATVGLGDASSGGVAALLGPEAVPGLSETGGGADWSLEVAHGTGRGHGMVGGPYGRMNGTREIESLRLGYRIEPDAAHAEDVKWQAWADLSAGRGSVGAGLEWAW